MRSPVREASRMKTRSPAIFPASGSSSFTRWTRRRSNDSATTAADLTRTFVNPSFTPASEMREKTLQVLLGVRGEGPFVRFRGEVEDLVLVLRHRRGGADGDLAAVDRVHADGRRERQRGAHRLVLRGGRWGCIGLCQVVFQLRRRRFLGQ